MSQPDPAPSAPEQGPGRMLASLRDGRKLSVSEVAQRLKYGARQIEALEAEEFDKLPGATFIRGMVRSYAKLLDADPRPLLDALDRRYVPSEIELDLRSKGTPFAPSSRKSTWIYLGLSALVFIVIAGVLYEWRKGALPRVEFGQAAAPSPQPPAPPAPARAEPQAPPPGATTAPPSPPQPTVEAPLREGRIQLQFASQSWVEIKEENGRMLMSQLHAAGSKSVIVGRPPLTLVIGNAADVRLVYNDKPIDLKPYINIEVARLTLK